jgi:hypothetical protein
VAVVVRTEPRIGGGAAHSPIARLAETAGKYRERSGLLAFTTFTAVAAAATAAAARVVVPTGSVVAVVVVGAIRSAVSVNAFEGDQSLMVCQVGVGVGVCKGRPPQFLLVARFLLPPVGVGLR